jgi:DUF971 family protein
MTTGEDPRALKPRNIAVAGRELAVAWGDGHESYFPFERLRRECPCAACRARTLRSSEANPLRVVKAPRPEDLTIVRLVPVGAYAVQIVWSDGHDTGIYPFEMLRLSCPCDVCKAAPGDRAGGP